MASELICILQGLGPDSLGWYLVAEPWLSFCYNSRPYGHHDSLLLGPKP